MDSAASTRERILEAAERLLRRFGPSKTTVTDVARDLGMSHANVYRHFASKVALQEAIAERWLARISTPLTEIAAGDAPAAARLEAWLVALARAKRAKVRDEPELFATYHALAASARDVVAAHLVLMRTQVARIIADGAAGGEFVVRDADAAAGAVLDATLRFHHPDHVIAAPADDDDALRRIIALLLAGLRAGAV